MLDADAPAGAFGHLVGESRSAGAQLRIGRKQIADTIGLLLRERAGCRRQGQQQRQDPPNQQDYPPEPQEYPATLPDCVSLYKTFA